MIDTAIEQWRAGLARLEAAPFDERPVLEVVARRIEDELRRRRSAVGRASVYRAVDQLEELGLVQRFEASRGIASYERVDPGGHHHHHAICRVCGRVEAFEDGGLESAIGRIEGRIPFEVSEHDVVLRGRCARCAATPN